MTVTSHEEKVMAQQCANLSGFLHAEQSFAGANEVMTGHQQERRSQLFFLFRKSISPFRVLNMPTWDFFNI